MMGHHSKTLLFSGQFSVVDDEAQVDDLMSILKNEVGNKRNKNVDILSLASQICLRLNGKIMFFFFSQNTKTYFQPFCVSWSKDNINSTEII